MLTTNKSSTAEVVTAKMITVFKIDDDDNNEPLVKNDDVKMDFIEIEESEIQEEEEDSSDTLENLKANLEALKSRVRKMEKKQKKKTKKTPSQRKPGEVFKEGGLTLRIPLKLHKSRAVHGFTFKGKSLIVGSNSRSWYQCHKCKRYLAKRSIIYHRTACGTKSDMARDNLDRRRYNVDKERWRYEGSSKYRCLACSEIMYFGSKGSTIEECIKRHLVRCS